MAGMIAREDGIEPPTSDEPREVRRRSAGELLANGGVHRSEPQGDGRDSNPRLRRYAACALYQLSYHPRSPRAELNDLPPA